MPDKEVPHDPRQAIRWAYALFLGRSPESEQVIDDHILTGGGASVDVIRRRMFQSPEFVSNMQSFGFSLAAPPPISDTVRSLLQDSPAATPGAFTDRFGVRTRTSYLPDSYGVYAGQVGSADGAYDMPIHETEELDALLRSVAEADTRFAALELGAGWGPWIVLGGTLARRRGMRVTLAGVEGSEEHVAFMRSHLADNGFDPAEHQAIHAIAGTEDGVAYFPKLVDPRGNWGAEASFGAAPTEESAFEAVPCLSLATLLDRMPVLDFLHCDVQGAEADVFGAAIEKVNARVRRTCIGTHSRSIEAVLLGLLSEHGWVLEAEKPCSFVQQGAKLTLTGDGVQVWRNPRL